MLLAGVAALVIVPRTGPGVLLLSDGNRDQWTGGATFDARSSSLSEVFRDIRGSQ